MKIKLFACFVLSLAFIFSLRLKFVIIVFNILCLLVYNLRSINLYNNFYYFLAFHNVSFLKMVKYNLLTYLLTYLPLMEGVSVFVVVHVCVCVCEGGG